MLSLQDMVVIIIAALISSSGLLISQIAKDRTGAVVIEDDGNTFPVFRLSIPLMLAASLAIYFIRVGRYEQASLLAYAGCFLVAAGLLTRWIAVAGLGKAFKVRVSIIKGQKLKTNGIYKWIRHPSYTGLLLYYFGLGLVMHNWICLSLLAAVPLIVVLKRIKLEERVLCRHFGDEYSTYALSTWKLVPFIF